MIMEKNMKRRVMINFVCMMAAGSTLAATYVRNGVDTTWDGVLGWADNSTGSFVASTVMPGASDTFVLNNVTPLSVDTDATIAVMHLVNTANNATVNVDTAGKTLRVNGAVNVGNTSASGVGTLNVTAGTLVLGASSSIHDLLDINGGTLTIDNALGGVGLNGAGLLKLQSGTFQTTGPSVGTFANDFEISGGTVDIASQTLFTGNLSIIGDVADISIVNFNGSNGGNLNYVMGENGISLIDSSASWSHLNNTVISVDGSAYTGGTGTFTLFKSGNLASMSSDYDNVTGFTGGLSGSISQEGNTVVLTVIPEPATLGLIAAFGGGILFIRRMFQM